MSTWTILPLVLTLVVNDPIPAATFRFEPCPLEPRNESEDRLTAWQAPTPLRIVVFCLVRISRDIVLDQKSGTTYYLVHIATPTEEVARLDGLKLMPGMLVDAYIQTDAAPCCPPEGMREVAEKGVAQARDVYEKAKATAEERPASWRRPIARVR